MKDWNNISDEEFDDVFRDSSLNHKEEVWPDAWPLMEEKLEEENRKRRLLIFWRSAAAILIFGTLGILSIGYFKKDSFENKTAKIDNNNPITAIKKENKAAEKVSNLENNILKQINDASDLSQIQKATHSKTEINSVSIIKANTVTKSVSILKQKLDLVENYTNSKIYKKGEIPTNTKLDNELISNKLENQNATIQNRELEPTLEKKDLTLNEKESKTTDLTKSNDASVVMVNTKAEEIYFKQDTVIILTGQTETQTNQSNSTEASEALSSENSKIFKKLALNLGFSPDYSRVVASEFGRMGHNLQVILDYQINPKWVLRAGIIKSLKMYDAYPDDYAWPVKWGKPSSPLKEVTATCDMLDIPVSLSYKVLEKGPNKLYTSLGITNYKMMKEKYEYWYENDADPNLKWRKWEGSTGFFGAGVVNVSVGLERKLTNFLSVQVEPFVKIPVRNVGFGSVKLLTTGLFLNVKTQAPRKKNATKMN